MTTTFTPIFIAGIVYTLGEIVYTPSVQTLGADLMNPEKIGSYNGVAAIKMPIASILLVIIAVNRQQKTKIN